MVGVAFAFLVLLFNMVWPDPGPSGASIPKKNNKMLSNNAKPVKKIAIKNPF